MDSLEDGEVVDENGGYLATSSLITEYGVTTVEASTVESVRVLLQDHFVDIHSTFITGSYKRL